MRTYDSDGNWDKRQISKWRQLQEACPLSDRYPLPSLFVKKVVTMLGYYRVLVNLGGIVTSYFLVFLPILCVRMCTHVCVCFLLFQKQALEISYRPS